MLPSWSSAALLEWLYTAGGEGGYPPSPPDQCDHGGGKHRNFQSGNSCRAIIGTQTFGTQTPPPPLLILPCCSPKACALLTHRGDGLRTAHTKLGVGGCVPLLWACGHPPPPPGPALARPRRCSHGDPPRTAVFSDRSGVVQEARQYCCEPVARGGTGGGACLGRVGAAHNVVLGTAPHFCLFGCDLQRMSLQRGVVRPPLPPKAAVACGSRRSPAL